MSILPFPLVRPPVERLFSAGVLHLNQPRGSDSRRVRVLRPILYRCKIPPP